MLGQTRQIRMILSGLEDNIRALLQEREKYAPEVEKLRNRIKELENELKEIKNGYKENSSESSSEVPSNDVG